MSHILGYARVSTDDQDLAGQKQRLASAGAFRVFEDVISGKTFDRPGLTDLLDHIRPGDTLAVVRLDRLGRSPTKYFASGLCYLGKNRLGRPRSRSEAGAQEPH